MDTRSKLPGLVASIVLVLAGLPASAGTAADAAAVVQSFCAAINSRNLDAALATFAPGGVQFNLRPAHTGLGGPQGLTGDLKAHWSMIGPVLFASTTSYSRKAEILDTRVEGDLATVWARISTESVQKGSPTPRRGQFVEMYLLVKQGGQWKIGAMADNRAPGAVVPGS